jgi:hypothetical protein
MSHVRKLTACAAGLLSASFAAQAFFTSRSLMLPANHSRTDTNAARGRLSLKLFS